MKTSISVVLCTFNNANSLALTLKELADQKVPVDASVEIIIVDNNSPDNTAAVVAPFLNHPHIRFSYVFEGQQGLSFARNSGVFKASGEYILFTDDDAAIPSDWITEYIHQINHHTPDCIYSKIDIIWDKPQPWWFVPEFTPCFVGLNYGDCTIIVEDNRKEFYGKNFCIRKQLLLELGGFDPALGRKGTSLAAGEETLLYRKLIDQKKKVVYFPSAKVGHRLKPREYHPENIKKLYIDGAYSTYHIATICARKKILGKPVGLFVDTLKKIPTEIYGLISSIIKSNRARTHFYWLCIRRSFKIISLWMTR